MDVNTTELVQTEQCNWNFITVQIANYYFTNSILYIYRMHYIKLWGGLGSRLFEIWRFVANIFLLQGKKQYYFTNVNILSLMFNWCNGL